MRNPREIPYFAVAVTIAGWILLVIVIVGAAAEMTGNGYMGGRTPTW